MVCDKIGQQDSSLLVCTIVKLDDGIYKDVPSPTSLIFQKDVMDLPNSLTPHDRDSQWIWCGRKSFRGREGERRSK